MHPHRSALLILWFAVLFAGCADRIEIEGPIPDREPSKAWSADLKERLKENMFVLGPVTSFYWDWVCWDWGSGLGMFGFCIVILDMDCLMGLKVFLGVGMF